jgi:DNA-binding GntR family transcriptional regulator
VNPDASAIGSPGSPLGFTTKAEAVYTEIRRRIIGGILEPAAPLNQEALAPELGVSVTPVREAVRRLEAEGLVQFHAHKSVVVTPLSPTELREIYEVRLRLDPFAASLASKNATDDELDEIGREARAPVSRDPLDRVTRNRAFHRQIYSKSGNQLLTEILDQLWERTDRYRIVLLRNDVTVFAAVREHIAIADAIKARQGRSVARLVRDHIMNARDLISDALR